MLNECRHCTLKPGDFAIVSGYGNGYDGLCEIWQCVTPERKELEYHIMRVQVLNGNVFHNQEAAIYTKHLKAL